MTDTKVFNSRMIDEVAIAIAKEDMKQLDPSLADKVTDDLAREWIRKCKSEGVGDDIRAVATVAVQRTMEMLIEESKVRNG